MTTKSEDKFKVLPLELKTKILYYAIVGKEQPTFNYCRYVCKDWNQIIKRSVWQSPTKEWGEITKVLMKRWVFGSYPTHKMMSHAKDLETGGVLPTGVIKTIADNGEYYIKKSFALPGPARLEDMTLAGSLAHLGLLGPLNSIDLDANNQASIPAQHLASLLSCVKHVNISGCDNIETIMESVQSFGLRISNQCLSSGETQALVLAMETRVEKVSLSLGVTVDIEALTKYSGQGRCHTLGLCEADVEKLEDWCKEGKNWNVTREVDVDVAVDHGGIKCVRLNQNNSN